MADKRWAWGECELIGNNMVFESNEVAGGYECKFCSIKLNKRWDVLVGHLKSCKKVVLDFDKEVENIAKIKVKCFFCHLPFDMTGVKEARHLKSCKHFKAVIQGRDLGKEKTGVVVLDKLTKVAKKKKSGVSNKQRKEVVELDKNENQEMDERVVTKVAKKKESRVINKHRKKVWSWVIHLRKSRATRRRTRRWMRGC